MSAGRPSDYSQAIADLICERIADGESLRSICIADDMPNKATVFRWLAAHKEFSDQYARARETQADTLVDEILDIADDGWRENGEAIRRSQMRIDARKWMAGKMRPKKYGDKTLLGSDPENPLPEGFKVTLVKAKPDA
jgi:hypothetical protein